jgi:hypothetical protein
VLLCPSHCAPSKWNVVYEGGFLNPEGTETGIKVQDEAFVINTMEVFG